MAISAAATTISREGRVMSSGGGSQFADHLLELLAPLGPVAAKRFFGGIGILQGPILFAMIMDETLYFRVDAESRPRYEGAGSRPFSYATKTGTRTIHGFFTVPESLLDEPDEICDWARTAIAVAGAVKARRRPRKRRGG
jgi:DNA transformation protein